MLLSKDQEKKLKGMIGSKSRRNLVYAVFRPGMRVNSYWQSGYRDYWFVVNPRTGACKEIPQNGTPYDKLDLSLDVLAEGEILVRKSVHGSKEYPITIYK
jgi:hypothetical protein